MSVEELQFKVDELNHRLSEQDKDHREAVKVLLEQIKNLKDRLVNGVVERQQKAEKLQGEISRHDAFARHVEWRLDDYSGTLRTTPRNESKWSPEFSVVGVKGMNLEFFPNGRESTVHDGFCSLFLWCPAGVKIKYQLRVGTHYAAPDIDDFAQRMGHGHSNFCYLEAQVDRASDSVTVGIHILDISMDDTTSIPGLRLGTKGPEALVYREAELLRYRDHDTVEWRIRNIRRRVREAKKGFCLYSPLCSIAGVRQMLLEFYPCGPATSNKDDHCGFYLRCPSGTQLIVTLFVGKHVKGPIEAIFGTERVPSSKGLPEFCRLQEQIVEGEEDLIVGIKVRNRLLDPGSVRQKQQSSSSDFQEDENNTVLMLET